MFSHIRRLPSSVSDESSAVYPEVKCQWTKWKAPLPWMNMQSEIDVWVWTLLIKQLNKMLMKVLSHPGRGKSECFIIGNWTFLSPLFVLPTVWECPYIVWDCPYIVWECLYIVWDCPYIVWECLYIVWECPCIVWECPYIVWECHYRIVKDRC